jgi:hypothetical protein
VQDIGADPSSQAARASENAGNNIVAACDSGHHVRIRPQAAILHVRGEPEWPCELCRLQAQVLSGALCVCVKRERYSVDVHARACACIYRHISV